ncbi:MAG: PIN domain nuclease [Actinomycetota bacterium]|nr:PIN domain nuclease [Actinomycetota bacterium]
MTVLVDSSVWIAYLRDSGGPELELLEQLIGEQTAATTDVVLLEVLAGTTDEERAARLRRFLAGAELLRQQSPVDAEHAAALYRACRRAGETPRSLNDCLVAAVALRHGVPVLHRDHDFTVLAAHTDLRVVDPGA